MSILQNIIVDQIMWRNHIASQSHYDIVKKDESFLYEGKTWTYYNSGLAREVYVSDCGNFVIKIPITTLFIEGDEKRWEKNIHRCPPSVKHNYYEALAYEECPKEFKKYLARTELIEHGWVRQEFVKVIPLTFRHDLKELGQREDGSFCIFDFDPLLWNFEFKGFNWTSLPTLIDTAIKHIKK